MIGGIDYFGDWGGRIVALDLNLRRVKWSTTTARRSPPAPSIHGNTLYIGDYGGRLLALDRRNGSEIWTGAR